MILSGPPRGYVPFSTRKTPVVKDVSSFAVEPKQAAYRNLAVKEPDLGRMIQCVKPQQGVVPNTFPQKPRHQPRAAIGYNPGVALRTRW